MPDDHSKLVPLLPIPNRTVKRLSADDSADSCVKVGHCQAIKPELAQLIFVDWAFSFGASFIEFVQSSGLMKALQMTSSLVQNVVTFAFGNICFDKLSTQLFNPG